MDHDWKAPDDEAFGTRALPATGTVQQERCTRCLLWATPVTRVADCGVPDYKRSYFGPAIGSGR